MFVDPGGVAPDLLSEVGVTMPSGIVLDTPIYPHEDRPLLRYRSHPITEDLAPSNIRTFVAHAAPTIVEPREGVRAAELLTTSPRGWIERGSERPATYTEGEDAPGPTPVAVALEVGRPHPLVEHGTARILAVGDADVYGDELLAEGPGNATFVVNSVRWLVHADERMGRIGAPARIRKLAMTPEQLASIRWLVAGVLPLLAVLGGGAVWAIRRGR